MIYDTASNKCDLEAILTLQAENLPAALSEFQMAKEGFVTVHHNRQILSDMSKPYCHIVARDHDLLAGYALVMLKKFAKDIPVLVPMSEELETAVFNGELICELNYVLMGQICVAKAYRRQGVFNGLYNKMKSTLRSNFDYIVTEVDIKNQPSIRAHQSIGFECVREYISDDKTWNLLIWDINSKLVL